MNNKWVWGIAGVLIGAIVAPKLMAWSGGRLPQVGGR